MSTSDDEQMTLHIETYNDVGVIETFVQDMQAVWERERDRQRVSVSLQEAVRFPLLACRGLGLHHKT